MGESEENLVPIFLITHENRQSRVVPVFCAWFYIINTEMRVLFCIKSPVLVLYIMSSAPSSCFWVWKWIGVKCRIFTLKWGILCSAKTFIECERVWLRVWDPKVETKTSTCTKFTRNFAICEWSGRDYVLFSSSFTSFYLFPSSWRKLFDNNDDMFVWMWVCMCNFS